MIGLEALPMGKMVTGKKLSLCLDSGKLKGHWQAGFIGSVYLNVLCNYLLN